MELVYAVMGLALLELFVFQMFVGRARVKYGIEAPATSGNEMFERYYRVHYNSIEMLVLFLPSMLLFANFVNTTAAWVLGLVYVVGRLMYFRGYIAEPKKRAPGFGLSFLPVLIMLLGGTGGALFAAFS